LQMTTQTAGHELVEEISPPATVPSGSVVRVAWGDWIFGSGAILLCVLHSVLVWIGIGGRSGLTSEWPLLQSDHGLHYQHGLLARQFLATTGMSAGYDPSFMSGYPMSIVTDLSSTLSDLVMLPSGDRPAQFYKSYVFVCASLVPWLMALASIAWRCRPTAMFITVFFSLIYFWSDFAYKYVGLGMVSYLLSVPLGLITTALLVSYLEKGGFGRWLQVTCLASAVFLVHMTSPMLIAPAALLAYGVAIFQSRKDGRPLPISRHLGLWLMAPAIIAVNAFWLYPGFLLASTKGPSDFAFANSEGVLRRVGEVFWNMWPHQPILLALAPVGLILLRRRQPLAVAGLGGFIAIGFAWGYLAGAFRSLDSLQPGRHTYACYSAACITAGIALEEVLSRLRKSGPDRLDRWMAMVLVIVAIRNFGYPINDTIQTRIFAEVPFLSSKPTVRTQWVVSKVRKHVKPGERLLFEETGLGSPGLIDPFAGRHISPILPAMTGVEVLGGPYLHATVTTNFTQFGENKLFERTNWNRNFFNRYSQLYRPSAICCWSPNARAFCRANPDLIRVIEDDGTMLLGRVIGFEGSTIRGTAEVEASPNRLVVRNAVADASGDGKVVLRYHSVPYLKAEPAIALEEVLLEDDPVPFIQISPTTGPVTIEMALPSPFKPRR
jgi:hypothetical protein